MAFKYVQCWLPAASCLYIDAIFDQRRYVLRYVPSFQVSFVCRSLPCMALRSRKRLCVMSKYYWSCLVAFSMAMFVVLYYCFNEAALTDDASNIKLNVFGNDEFDSEDGRVDNVGKHFGAKELSKKCEHLYDTAMDMLYNGEKVALPFETNQTRWDFHKRANLDYLDDIKRRWRQPPVHSTTSFSRTTQYVNTRSKRMKTKKYFITFACNCCTKAKVKAINAARDPGGFDFTTVHDQDSLSKKFRVTHSGILRNKRGCGYWLWKPYVILKTLLESMSDGDLLMYQDAGAHLIRDAGPLLQLCEESDPGIIIFHTDFFENHFTKRDAFILMDMEDTRVYESYQRLASFLILRKNCQTLQFVMEWLAYASDARILTDMENQMGKKNFPTFRENRHDQTVLSLLSKRWHLNEYRDPSQYGNIDEKYMYSLGPYKQLIYHSRDTS